MFYQPLWYGGEKEAPGVPPESLPPTFSLQVLLLGLEPGIRTMEGKQHIFFDLGWTLEDETKAQIDRAEKAAIAAKAFVVDTTADQMLQLQEEGAELQVHEVFPYALSKLGLDNR